MIRTGHFLQFQFLIILSFWLLPRLLASFHAFSPWSLKHIPLLSSPLANCLFVLPSWDWDWLALWALMALTWLQTSHFRTCTQVSCLEDFRASVLTSRPTINNMKEFEARNKIVWRLYIYVKPTLRLWKRHHHCTDLTVRLSVQATFRAGFSHRHVLGDLDLTTMFYSVQISHEPLPMGNPLRFLWKLALQKYWAFQRESTMCVLRAERFLDPKPQVTESSSSSRSFWTHSCSHC